MVSIADPFKAIYGWFTSKGEEGSGKEIIAILEQIAQGNFKYSVKLPTGKGDEEHVQIIKGLQLTLRELRKFERREKQRRKQLEAANKQLLVLDKNKREFMELASHQLKTPLASMQLGLDILERKAEEWSADERLILDEVNSSYEHLAHLVKSMLDAVRIDEKMSMDPQFQKTSISQIISVLEKHFRNQIEAKGLEFVVERPSNSCTIKTDPGFIIEVLQNLLENAWKYTESGRVCLAVSMMDKYVEFVVSDSGIGIPLTEQSKVFDKMFRASNVKNLSDVGSGLGLYYTKQLVKKLKGKISFASEVGSGSSFRVLIPR